MKIKWLSFGFIVVLIFSVFMSLTAVRHAGAADRTGCVLISDDKFDSCQNKNGMSIKVTNNCGGLVNTEFCLERTKGDWDCGRDSAMTSGRSTTYFTCNATGNYKWIACDVGERCRVPNIRTREGENR